MSLINLSLIKVSFQKCPSALCVLLPEASAVCLHSSTLLLVMTQVSGHWFLHLPLPGIASYSGTWTENQYPKMQWCKWAGSWRSHLPRRVRRCVLKLPQNGRGGRGGVAATSDVQRAEVQTSAWTAWTWLIVQRREIYHKTVFYLCSVKEYKCVFLMDNEAQCLFYEVCHFNLLNGG